MTKVATKHDHQDINFVSNKFLSCCTLFCYFDLIKDKIAFRLLGGSHLFCVVLTKNILYKVELKLWSWTFENYSSKSKDFCWCFI